MENKTDAVTRSDDVARSEVPAVYTTRALLEASYLQACGWKPQVVAVDARTACFEFPYATPELLNSVNEFNRGQGQVNIQRFEEARLSLRRAVADVLDGPPRHEVRRP